MQPVAVGSGCTTKSELYVARRYDKSLDREAAQDWIVCYSSVWHFDIDLCHNWVSGVVAYFLPTACMQTVTPMPVESLHCTPLMHRCTVAKVSGVSFVRHSNHCPSMHKMPVYRLDQQTNLPCLIQKCDMTMHVSQGRSRKHAKAF